MRMEFIVLRSKGNNKPQTKPKFIIKEVFKVKSEFI